MSLRKYNEKRSFDKSPEPRAGVPKGNALRFVIQKHAASRLHYDFRLEIKGVLKSWAVPKGPSMDPKVKRLAMMVEDHPYDYKDFEGSIPDGNYGAGNVIIWDEGSYTTIDGSQEKGVPSEEKSLLAQLKAGNLKFSLKGKKLKGDFALVRTHGSHMAENSWLLIKHADKYASTQDITKRDTSVRTGKPLKEKATSTAKKTATKKTIAKKSVPGTAASKKEPPLEERTDVFLKQASKKEVVNKNSIARKKKQTDLLKKELIQEVEKLPDTQMPEKVSPMLATLVDRAFDDEDWSFEIKWDGYRTLTYSSNGNVELLSRNQNSFTHKFYPIASVFEQLKLPVVFDGEVVVVNTSTGRAEFSALQNWKSFEDGQLLYYVFDILWYKGKSVVDLALSKRMLLLEHVFEKEKLREVSEDIIRLSYNAVAVGKHFFDSVASIGLEGMIAKRLDSSYKVGRRSGDWLKIKVQQRQEVIIVGYTHKKDSPKLFSALLLAVYSGDALVYVGKVGTGFTDALQKELMAEFRALKRKTNPLSAMPEYNKATRYQSNPLPEDISWLTPKLVAEISFTERTKDGVFRHPSFKGMRIDKAAKDVVWEASKSRKEVLGSKSDLINSNGRLEKSKANETQKKTNTKLSATQKVGKMKKATLQTNKQTDEQTSKRSVKPSSDKTQSSSKKTVSKPEIAEGKQPSVAKKSKSSTAKITQELLLDGSKNKVSLNIGNQPLIFTNLDKVYWPASGITKRDLLNYYDQMAPFILPYLKGRPQSLNRYPGGIDQPNFYQKDITGKIADWLSTFLYHAEGDRTDKHFLVADGKASLLYMVNLGCIELNPWSSTVKVPTNPTWCIIDLDPDKNTPSKRSFDGVVKVALKVHEVLNDLNIHGYPKTSGSTGMHIYIPLGGKYSYEASKEFARLIVTLVQRALPSLTTLERTVADRKGKIYLDFLQNRPQATIAAPYSVRPKPGATVSMPLDWSEIKTGLRISDFTLKNAVGMANDRGDLFKPVLGKGVNIAKVIKALS